VPVLQRARQTEQVVPVVGDQVQVGLLGQQRPGSREAFLVVGLRAHPVQGDLAQVADAGRELLADQVEEAEVDQGHAVRISRVLADRQVGGVAQDLVQHVRASRCVATMTFVPKVECWSETWV
jgi:hypothetical protein